MGYFNKIIKKYKSEFLFELPLYNNTEKSTILYEDSKIKVEKIISYGYKSPNNFWYEQNEKEYVYILQGSGTLLFENNNEVILKQGDKYLIESNLKHKVCYTSLNPPCVWLCMFVK